LRNRRTRITLLRSEIQYHSHRKDAETHAHKIVNQLHFP